MLRCFHWNESFLLKKLFILMGFSDWIGQALLRNKFVWFAEYFFRILQFVLLNKTCGYKISSHLMIFYAFSMLLVIQNYLGYPTLLQSVFLGKAEVIEKNSLIKWILLFSVYKKYVLTIAIYVFPGFPSKAWFFYFIRQSLHWLFGIYNHQYNNKVCKLYAAGKFF